MELTDYEGKMMKELSSAGVNCFKCSALAYRTFCASIMRDNWRYKLGHHVGLAGNNAVTISNENSST